MGLWTPKIYKMHQNVPLTLCQNRIVTNTSDRNVRVPGSIFFTKVQVPRGAAVARRMASSIYPPTLLARVRGVLEYLYENK